MKVLVTGGAGFIGSHLLKRLNPDYFNVLVLDDLSTGKLSNVPLHANFLRGNITDYNVCLKATENIETVIHLAALISVTESMIYPEKYEYVNSRGTENMLYASKFNKVKRFIFISSAACYFPKSIYALTKLKGEELCQKSGLNAICMRVFNVYGPGQKKEYAGVISKFIECRKNHTPPVIYGDGSKTRDFIYVDDVVGAITKSLYGFDSGGFYDVGTGIGTSINELAKMICGDVQPIYDDDRPEEVAHSKATFIKSDFKAKTLLKDGMDILLDNE